MPTQRRHERSIILCMLLLLATLSAAQPGYSLDGLHPGMEAGQVTWLEPSAKDGQHTHQGTTVELLAGRVVGVWGQSLQSEQKSVVKLGDPDPQSVLGKPDRKLYGCGPDGGQQVLFYDRHGLLVTVENGNKVVGLCLQSSR